MPDHSGDLMAIKDIAYLYAQAVDRRDYQLLATIMTRQCVLRGPGFEHTGLDKIISAIKQIEHYKSTYHAVQNQLISIDGQQARGEIYCTASHFYDREGIERKLDWGIRYQDQYIQRQSGWRLAARELILDWQQDAPTHFTGN